jgi:hypothetical protein
VIEYCLCGCGNLVKKEGNKYLHGHNHKNKTYEEIYGKDSESKKESRRVAIIGTIRPDMIGEKNIAKREEVRMKIKDKVKKSWINNEERRIKSGNILKNLNMIITKEEIKNRTSKALKSRQDRGFCLRDEELEDFSLYKRKVRQFTIRSIKEKYLLEDLKNIGRNKKLNCIDHIFSIQNGFKCGVLPSIIGSKSNIRIMNFSDNCKKHSTCEIELQELFKKYDMEKCL